MLYTTYEFPYLALFVSYPTLVGKYSKENHRKIRYKKVVIGKQS